jgi:uncharacterized coiled-coil protein SlyX
MTAGLAERAEYEAAKRDEKMAKTKKKVAKLRMHIKWDEDYIRDYIRKTEEIEEMHIGKIRGKIDHLNGKIKDLQYTDIEMRVRRDDEAELGAAKRDALKAKRAAHVAKIKMKIAHLDEKIKYYVEKMKYLEERHIAKIRDRISKNKQRIKDLEHAQKW